LTFCTVFIVLKEKSIPSLWPNADDRAAERYEVGFGDMRGDLNRSYTPIFLDEPSTPSGESTELSFFTLGAKLILRL
jgi:hypothetical protein